MGRKRDSNKTQNHSRRDKKRTTLEEGSDNDSVLNDTASVASGYSNTSKGFAGDLDIEPIQSGRSSPIDTDQDDEIDSDVEDYSHRISLVLDDLEVAKSLKTRISLYNLLNKALITRYCGDGYLDNRKMALLYNLEHGLKRLGDEAGSAAHILSLTLITTGDSPYSDELFRSVYPLLERILIDPSGKPMVRSRCAIAASLGCFITDYGLEVIDELMSQLLSITFSSVRGHPDAQQLSAVNSLKSTCLHMFNFLSTVADDTIVVETIRPNMNKLIKCLESNDLELRVAAGECIALIYENCMEKEEDFDLFSLHELREKFSLLANDSQKSKSKKELRTQRNNFRQILRTIESDSYSPETIKFGGEKLIIDSWKMKRYYDTFCSVLGSGMNLHLGQNPLLRDIFGLGPVILDPMTKNAKLELKHVNHANRKMREMSRSKMRGKRGDFDHS